MSHSSRVIIGKFKFYFVDTTLMIQVEFADGQSVATITITIRDDTLPEIDETKLITLIEVLEPGTNLLGKGAIIGKIFHL